MATEDYEIITKILDCDGMASILVQYPVILDKLRNENNAELKAVNKPIICTISRNKVQKLEAGDRPLNTTLSSEAIKSIYYITPNPKNLGGTNFIESTILEENESYKHFASRINMLIFQQVGLGKTPVFLYMTDKIPASIDREVDIYQILSKIKNSF